MKGLIYREIYLSRKGCILTFSIAMFMMITGILIRLSMKIGNLANLSSDSFEATDMMTYFMFSFFVPFLFFLLSSNGTEILSTDYKTKYMLFQYSMPVKEEKIVLAKYITIIGYTVVAFIPSFINAITIGELSDRPLSKEVICMIFMIMCGSMCFTLITMTLIFLLHSIESAVIVFVIMFIGGYMWFCFSLDSNNLETLGIKQMEEIIVDFCVKYLSVALIITSVLIVATYFINVKLLKRRLK